MLQMRETEAQREKRLSLVIALAYGSKKMWSKLKEKPTRHEQKDTERMGRREGEEKGRRGRGRQRETQKEEKRQNELEFAADLIWFLDPAMPEIHTVILVIKLIDFFYLSQLEMCFSHLQPEES